MADDGLLPPGTTVSHEFFGNGIIIDNEIKENDWLYEVRFEDNSVRIVLSSFVNLIESVEDKKARAKKLEKGWDFDAAIQLWEEMGKPEEAARVRKLKANLAAPKTEIHGDYVDNRDTVVKDSVISRSNIGPGGDGDDLAAKLQQLAQMHGDGILSDEQFEAAKNKLRN